MHPVVRAIDVGFGNTKYVAAVSDERVECAHFPSLAFHSTRDLTHDSIGGRRKTVAVPIGDLFYEVGPEIELAADRFRVRHLHDNYVQTREYRALWCGALHYMKVEQIDLLVVGLPVAHYLEKKVGLERAMTGEFDVGRSRKVRVRKTLVVAQPQGALFHYAATHGRIQEILGERNLVIDVGSRTLDWLVTSGTKVISKLSHSVDRGVSDVLREIAGHIGTELETAYRDLEAIDLALRTGKNPKIFQQRYDVRKFDAVVQEIAEQAVSSMMQHLDNAYAFENIVLVGGGAFMFRRAVKNAFPRHRIHEVKEPMYANVRGFQLAGMNHMKAGSQAHAQAREPASASAADGPQEPAA